jgi:hypothetical protein
LKTKIQFLRYSSMAVKGVLARGRNYAKQRRAERCKNQSLREQEYRVRWCSARSPVDVGAFLGCQYGTSPLAQPSQTRQRGVREGALNPNFALITLKYPSSCFVNCALTGEI